MTVHRSSSECQRLLLLSPSEGLGGGIERVIAAIERAWPGEVKRVDFQRGSIPHGPDAGRAPALKFNAVKAGFGGRALGVAALHRPDIVLAGHVGLLPVALAVAAPYRAATALFGYGTEVWQPFPATTRALIRRCTHLLAISSFTAMWMSRRAQVDPARIAVVPLPIEHEFARIAREETPRARDSASTLLTISRLSSEHRYKGHFAIVESLRTIGSERAGVRWLVVGGGDDLGRLQEACRAAGIERQVELWGNVDDRRLMDAYRAADFFVLPSVADVSARPPAGEGFGLVYAEAAAFGLPSIASTEGGGALEFVRRDVTGMTVPPGDAAALHDAIVQLLDDGERRRRLGLAAHALVRERHLPEHFAPALRRAFGLRDGQP